jgi:hypothetical protein
VGVEPTGDGIARHPPVLKTGTITGPHALPWRYEQKPRTVRPLWIRATSSPIHENPLIRGPLSYVRLAPCYLG